MQKKDLVQNMVSAGLNHKDAQTAVEVFINSVKDAFKNNEPITIRHFGTFSPKKRKARVGRNIRTGVTVNIPAKTVLAFKPSKHFE